MTNPYFWAFAAVVSGLLVWGLREPGRIYQFPFLAGVAFAGFVFPQIIGIVRNAGTFPPGAVDRLLLMGSLSAVMCWAGYVAAPQRWGGLQWRFDSRRLERGAWILLAIGLVFWVLIVRLPESELDPGGWSGIEVAYLFFARLTRYAFFLGLLIYLIRGGRTALLLTVLAAVPTVQAIVFAGRRAPTAELALGLAIAIWFIRGRSIPRAVFAPLALVAMLMASFSAGDYRSRVADGDVSVDEVASIPWWANVEEVLRRGGPELPNALYTLDMAATDGQYDYGASHWDFFVFSYVPAQIVGREVKESLYLDLGVGIGGRDEELRSRYGYRRSGGSTATGMTDSFLSFGYLGSLKFFVISLIMAQLWGAALQDDFGAQFLYLLLVVPAMHSVTHSTFWFFKDWPHIAFFVLPILVVAWQATFPSVRVNTPVNSSKR